MVRGFFRGLQARLLLVVILLLCLCCQAKDRHPDLDHLVAPILNWGETLNSPGATAELRLAYKELKGGLLHSAYDAYVDGIPHDQSYAVFQWPINASEPSVAYSEIYIAADGRLCKQENQCHDGSGPYLRLDFISARGEPHRIALISKDGKYKVAAMVVPSAIVVHDQECRVEIVRGTPKFELAIVRGEGFSPAEEIQYTSDSAGEKIRRKIHADDKGNFFLALMPFVKGRDEGIDRLAFSAAKCKPSIFYHWGTIDY